MVTTRLTVPQQLAQMDRDRLRGYREHLDFYNGLQWPSSRRRERRLTFNYVRAFIDKLASYLTQGMVVTAEPWDASPESRERAQRARAALDAVADANALTQLDYETEVDASILGDGCYKVTWDPEGETVRITAPDVQGVFAWWVGDDFSRTWRVASRYRLTSEEAEGLYGVAAEGAEVVVVEVWTEQTFSLWLDDLLLEERANPYGAIPFVLFPNLREPKKFWGLSDIPPLVEPQRELNRAFSQLSTILELSGNPIAVLEGVEEARDIAVQPGAVWELPGAGAGLPAGPAPRRRRAAAHGVHRPAVPGAPRPLGGAAHSVRGQCAQPVGRGAGDGAAPIAPAGASQAADPQHDLQTPRRHGPSPAGEVHGGALPPRAPERRLGPDPAAGPGTTGAGGAAAGAGRAAQPPPGHDRAGGAGPGAGGGAHPGGGGSRLIEFLGRTALNPAFAGEGSAGAPQP